MYYCHGMKCMNSGVTNMRAHFCNLQFVLNRRNFGSYAQARVDATYAYWRDIALSSDCAYWVYFQIFLSHFREYSTLYVLEVDARAT